jgi:bifunctional non-homologous end joining protein LigD
LVAPGWLDTLEEPYRRVVVAAEHPWRVEPQLAVTGGGARARDVYERKLDGMRLLVHVDGARVQLSSRTHEERSRGFPELVEAVAALGPRDLVADGEVVAYDGPTTSFSRLQRRIGLNDPVRARLTGVAVHLELFDLLHLDGHDLRSLPLRVRKRLLAHELQLVEPLRFVPHHEGDADVLLADACRDGWEGLIAKDPDAPYRSGRSSAWRKLKCSREGRFLIGGWTEPRGGRTGFGALLLGERDDDRLRYVGKVGTGFSDAMLAELTRALQRLERPSSPFDGPVDLADVHYAEPRLVATVAYTEWTDDGRLRHPRFQRVDVDPGR